MDDSLAIRSGEDAGSSAASPEAAQAHLQHAIRFLRQSQLEQAIFHARSSVRFAHSSWSSLEDLGLVLFRLGELFPLSFGVLLQAGRNGQLKERGLRTLSALFQSRGQHDQSRLCIEAMAMLATITGPKSLKPEYPNVLRLRSVEQSVFGIKQDVETGLCSLVFKGGHFSFNHLLNAKEVNLFTATVLGDNLLNANDLPRFDLIVNCLSCPDHDAKGLELIQRFLGQCHHIPVINAPHRISRTSRAENARRLGGLEHVSMPRTELFRCDQELDHVISKLEPAGFPYPLVVRRRGGHGANKMTKVDSSAALRDWLMESKLLRDFHATPYLDYRWGDGLFHKFRVFFIDGQIYPASHVISDHWEIHCDNPGLRDRHRLMASDPSLQEQEKRFLNDHVSYLGENALCALEQIQGLIGLDYFGIDFALDASGDLIVFEANAAMRQNVVDIDDFPYLRESVDRIANAFMEMVRSRCLSSGGNGLVS